MPHRPKIKGKILVEEGPGAGRAAAFALAEGEEVRIGKSPRMDMQLAERTISRHHATVFVREGKIWLRDEKSTNGTMVGGRPIRETPIQSGDLLHLGPIVVLRCVYRGAPASSPPAPRPSMEATRPPAAPGPARQSTPPPGPQGDATVLRTSRLATRHFLVGALPGQPPRAFELHPGDNIIGRDSSCHIQIPERSVSKRHARISVTEAAVTVEDLGSANGTYLGGQRTARALLEAGNRIAFDLYEFEYRQVAPGERLEGVIGPASPVATAPSRESATAPPPPAARPAENRVVERPRDAHLETRVESASGIAATRPTGPAPPRSPQAVRFTGEGKDLFLLWMKGFGLTMLTLGLYGPVAQRQVLEWSVEHWEVEGDRGELSLGTIELFVEQFKALLLSALTLFILTPSALLSFWRWVASRTRFGQRRVTLALHWTDLFVEMLVDGLLLLATAGLGAPWALARFLRFTVPQVRVGTSRLVYRGTGGTLARIYFPQLLMNIVTLGVAGPWGFCALMRAVAADIHPEGRGHDAHLTEGAR